MILSLRAKISSELSEGDAPPAGGMCELLPLGFSGSFFAFEPTWPGVKTNGGLNGVVSGDIIRTRR